MGSQINIHRTIHSLGRWHYERPLSQHVASKVARLQTAQLQSWLEATSATARCRALAEKPTLNLLRRCEGFA